MPTNIKDGTKNSDINLCKTCTRAVHVEGQRLDDAITFCNYLDKRITFKVSKCSMYRRMNDMDLYEMKTIAWLIDSKEGGKKIGFVPPNKFTKALKEVIDDISDPFDR
jgi:hypothetical protein